MSNGKSGSGTKPGTVVRVRHHLVITQLGCSEKAGPRSSQEAKTAGLNQSQVWGGTSLSTDAAAAQLLHSCYVALAGVRTTASAQKHFPKGTAGQDLAFFKMALTNKGADLVLSQLNSNLAN